MDDTPGDAETTTSWLSSHTGCLQRVLMTSLLYHLQSMTGKWSRKIRQYWDNLLVSPACLHLTGPENDNVETLDKWSATVNYCPTPQLLQTGGGPRRQLVTCANVCSSHIPIIIKNQSRSSNQPVRVITLSNLKCVVASSVGSRLKFYQTVRK